MTTNRQVYAALKTLVDTLEGGRCYEYPPGAPELPCQFLMPPAVIPEALGLEMRVLQLEVMFLVGTNEPSDILQLLDYEETTGPSSLLALIQANRNLGFPDVDISVVTWRPLALEEIAHYSAYGAACSVTVYIG